MKQILLGIAITLMGGVNLYAQSSQDITPAKYKYSTRSVGQEGVDGFCNGGNISLPSAKNDYNDQMTPLLAKYKNGLFAINGGQMPDGTTNTNSNNLQAGISIVDMGGEVGKVLCINGANSNFNKTFNVDYKKCSASIPGFLGLNWFSDPNKTPLGSLEKRNIHIKVVMNIYANENKTSSNVITQVVTKTKTNNLAVTNIKNVATNIVPIAPTSFLTEGKYDINKWMTYEFDTYCPSDAGNPIRLTMNLPYGAIDNATIFIKEITFTQTSTTTDQDNYKTNVSTINATALTYNEADTNKFKEITNTNLTINRQMTSDKWNTFCVPFALTSEQIDATFGKDTEVREYEGANGNVLTFKEATDIVAGTPYLIKPTKAAEKYIFNGVDITTTEAAKVGDGDIKFCGVYNQTNVNTLATADTHVSGIVDNMVKRASAGTSIKGFRAYFSVPNSTSESSEAALRVAIDGETTGIDAIEGIETNTPTRVYNLSGQYVGTSTANLKPGVYVSGGKKVIVK